MKADSREDIPATGRALFGAISGAVLGGIVGGYAIALFGSGQLPHAKTRLWFLAATFGIWLCLSVGLGVYRALYIVTGTMLGSVVGAVVGLATGTHNGLLFASTAGAVVGGVIGAYANRTPLKDKLTVDVYDRDLDG